MSNVNILRVRLRRFEFQEAFRELLNWNHAQTKSVLEVSGRTFMSRAIAEKGNVRVFEITEPEAEFSEAVPDPRLTAAAGRGLRERIDQKARELFGVCILAFINADRTECYWRFPRTDGKGRTYPERRYYRDRTPVDSLLTVLRHLEIPYELQDELGNIAHSLMLDRLAQRGARADRVTRRFFDQFDKSRKLFEDFLSWVDDEKQRTWYVTALLNRVMFIYFLQERGLLPDGNQYLELRLAEWKVRGANRFYREFLLPLCFFGFGTPQGERGAFEDDFRGVPYLDGGLFEVHEVEARFGITKEAVLAGTLPAGIVVPDAEFGRWFGFLGSWRWTLDEEAIENEGQINPGILGYIFEKYINQKELGAYYTKEDITGYICRSTIIPRLFDMLAETGDKGHKAVEPLPLGPHPNLLNDGKGISQGEGIDRYVYEAVKTTEYLPTETDREYAARQERYAAILQDFEGGKVRTVNDCITYNLDLERLGRDFILTIQDPEVLWLAYDGCLKRITVLDPAVGSGAFLLAAVNILFALYRAALQRMSELCARIPGSSLPLLTWKGEFAFANEVDTQLTFSEPPPPAVLDDMRAELSRIHDDHPNPEYFVYKTIIVNNLFGVDIVEEAVEICKLRLFLKLITHAAPDPAQPNQGVEPLPDIDFNILAGNSLVGYTRLEDLSTLRTRILHGLQTTMDLHASEDDLDAACRTYGQVLQRYRHSQLGTRRTSGVTREQVKDAAKHLRPKVNGELFKLYQRAGRWPGDDSTEPRFLATHQPLNWFVEFPDPIARGGFDAIIGNPPYVEYKSLRAGYELIQVQYASPYSNLYAYLLERSNALVAPGARLGMIVPVSCVSGDGYRPLMDRIRSGSVWLSSYSNRPGKLFDGVEQRLTIVLRQAHGPNTVYSASYQHWYAEERPTLFSRVSYVPASTWSASGMPVKSGSIIAENVFKKISAQTDALRFGADSGNYVWVHDGPTYWVRALPFEPNPGIQSSRSNHYHALPVTSEDDAFVIASILSSTTFYFFFKMVSNCRDLGQREWCRFPIKPLPDRLWGKLRDLGMVLRDRLKATASLKTRAYPSGLVAYHEYYPATAKEIIDQIDGVLAEHYGLDPVETRFITEYELKYRTSANDSRV